MNDGSAHGSRELIERVESLFPISVRALGSPILAHVPKGLHPDELSHLQSLGEKRRLEFATGRALARRLLAAYGVEGHPLLPGADRAPIWPRGLVGSISHCAGLCVVVVGSQEHARGIGIDVEPIRNLTERAVARVCTPAEIAAAADGGVSPISAAWPIVHFSAKESVYKAFHTATGRRLAFHDVEVTLRPGAHSFSVSLADRIGTGPWTFFGRFRIHDSHVVTGVTIVADAASPDSPQVVRDSVVNLT